MDLSDFIVALCPAEGKSTVHYEASVLPSGTWTKGVIDQGDASLRTGFYRVSHKVANGSVQADGD